MKCRNGRAAFPWRICAPPDTAANMALGLAADVRQLVSAQ